MYRCHRRLSELILRLKITANEEVEEIFSNFVSQVIEASKSVNMILSAASLNSKPFQNIILLRLFYLIGL